MASIMSIRDPHTGSLIAKGSILPQESDSKALLRLYGAAQGVDAREFEVYGWTLAESSEAPQGRTGPHQEDVMLARVGPRNRAHGAPLRTVVVTTADEGPRAVTFPIDRAQLEAMKRGERSKAVVPVPPDEPLSPGDVVTFNEAVRGSLGGPIVVPGGASLTVTLTEVNGMDHRWVDKELYEIAWDAAEATRSAKVAASERR